ncbi:hypothetical protein IH879_20520 [candidate division KSB1 bacterium]|nr:hypothetical protein [candidate division KSB1 bacterium]
MHTISRSSKLSCFFLIISLLVHPIFANQALSKDKIRVENVRFELVGEKIYIYYDLIGPQNKQYEITLTVRREQVQSTRVHPKLLKGDIGRGRFAGRNRQIVWDISREVPRALKASDYYFVVEAELVSSGSKALLWIGSATALLGVGSVVFLVLNKKNGDAGFPEPPGTPN